MTDIAQMLEVLSHPAHLEVIEERQELMRFGESQVTYQHSEHRDLVRARIIRDGRSAWGVATSTEPDAVQQLRDQLECVVRDLPGSEAEALVEPVEDGVERAVQTYFESTAEARAEDRAALLRRALEQCPSGATLGGSITHSVIHHSVANTTGLLRQEQRTRAGVQLIVANTHGDSWFCRAIHRDATALPLDQLLASVHTGLGNLPRRDLEPGEYRAVLGPQASMTLFAIYAQSALGGRQYQDGSSAGAGRMGQRIANPAISLVDDGSDAAGLPTTFDSAGRCKQRVALVENGVLTGVVYEASGHTAPPGWRFGADPIPSHLFVAPGESSDDDLVAACGTGVFIQRVDYVRVLNAKQTLVTGTTRDATRWIEHGRVAARVPQFRFTWALSDLLEDVELVGRRRERGDTVFMESVVAPPMLVSRLPVQTIVSS